MPEPRKRGRAAPPVVAELPCYVSDDRHAVLEAARRDLAIYPMMPAYADVLGHCVGRDAATITADGWTDDLTDAVVIWGDHDAVAAQVQAHSTAGADEVVLSPVRLRIRSGSQPRRSTGGAR